MNYRRTAYIKLHHCEVGMRLAEDVYNEAGALIVTQGGILDERLLQKIKQLNVERVKVIVESDSQQYDNTARTKIEYIEKVEIVKDIIYDLSMGKSLDVKAVNEVTTSLGTAFTDITSVMSCLNQVKNIDEYTYAHSLNVSLLCMLMAKWLKLDDSKVNDLLQTGLLHDIGKSQISLDIINKPGKLSDAEFEEMKKHPTLGYRALQQSRLSRDICLGVLMHHERVDGSGYPMAAKDEQITLYAKVTAITDIYAAMTSNRTYKSKECPFTTFRIIQDDAFGKLDLNMLNTFFSNMAHYYIGNFVRMDTGEVGEIIHINPRNIFRPLVKIDNTVVDLSVDTSLNIIDIL